MKKTFTLILSSIFVLGAYSQTHISVRSEYGQTYNFEHAQHTKISFLKKKVKISENHNTSATYVDTPKSNNHIIIDLKSYNYIESPNLDFSISSVGYSTFFSPVRYRLPNEVIAYAPTYNKKTGNLELGDEIEGGSVIPAGTALIMKGPEGAYSNEYYNQDDIWGIYNELTSSLDGSDVTLPLSMYNTNTIYTLANENNKLGFYEYAGETLQKNKAFFSLKKTVTQSGAKHCVLMFDDVTKLETVPSSSSSETRLSPYYNLSGQRVNPTQKGVYIHNGKSIIK